MGAVARRGSTRLIFDLVRRNWAPNQIRRPKWLGLCGSHHEQVVVVVVVILQTGRHKAQFRGLEAAIEGK